MKLFKKNKIVTIILFLILIVGNTLRTENYATVPHPGETADEYDYAWVGLSLLRDGIPVGWTTVENVYDEVWYDRINVDQLFDKNKELLSFRMAKPWLDQPPGFSLVLGAYTSFKGIDKFHEASTAIIRRPMLKIAVLTTILIFVLATLLYGKWVGLLSAFFYSIFPTTVVSSRLAMVENGYIPLFLSALIFTHLYISKKKDIYWKLAAAFSAAAILFKLSGISVLLSVLLILMYFLPKKKRKKVVVGTLSIGLLGLVGFVLYGAIIDWEVFKRVFVAQTNYFYGAGAEVFRSVFVNTKITAQKFLTDGWITFSWIAAFVVLSKEWKKNKSGTFLGISIFSYLIIFLIFGSESYGWYRFPFLPFLVIFAARFFEGLILKPNIPLATFMWLIPFGSVVHGLYGVVGFQEFVKVFRMFVVSVLGVVAYNFWSGDEKTKNLRRILIVLLYLFLFYLSGKLVMSYTYENWFSVT